MWPKYQNHSIKCIKLRKFLMLTNIASCFETVQMFYLWSFTGHFMKVRTGLNSYKRQFKLLLFSLCIGNWDFFGHLIHLSHLLNKRLLLFYAIVFSSVKQKLCRRAGLTCEQRLCVDSSICLFHLCLLIRGNKDGISGTW